MSTDTAQAGIFTRRMLAIAAIAAIAFSLALATRAPVRAADTKVSIHQTLPISSDGFTEDADCGDFTTGVVWHFTLVNYAGDDAQLFGTFADAGAFGPIDPTDKPSATIHFYVNTPDDDSLTDAYVMLGGTVTDQTQLQLSHVCHTGEEQSVPPSAEGSVAASVSASVPASVPASAEGSVKAGTGTPAASTSNTALFGDGSNPLATIAFSLILLASLGALAFANVKTVRRRI